jgi:hypothetical protein
MKSWTSARRRIRNCQHILPHHPFHQKNHIFLHSWPFEPLHRIISLAPNQRLTESYDSISLMHRHLEITTLREESLDLHRSLPPHESLASLTVQWLISIGLEMTICVGNDNSPCIIFFTQGSLNAKFLSLETTKIIS